jgi:hypothetical protein
LSVKSYLEQGEAIELELNQKVNIPFRIDDWVTTLLGISLFLSLTIVQTSQQSKFNFKGNIDYI